MTHEWYVSFHGGEGPDCFNNIHVYSTAGQELRKALNSQHLPPHVKLRELRGFTFGPDGNLYVVNAYFEYSEVLVFKGDINKDGQHDFLKVFVKHDKARNPGMLHPFNAIFGRDGNLYVTNQDTNVVSRYFGPGSTTGIPGEPMPLPVVLKDVRDKLSPGTFIPSAQHAADGLNMVRDALFTPDGLLYVADRDANCIKKYDGSSGKYLSRIDTAEKPIHLLLHTGGNDLYIGSGGTHSVLRHDFSTGTSTCFIAARAGGLKAPSGVAFGENGFFYVASRESKQILRYHEKDGHPDSKPFIDHLKDFPEFLLLVKR